MNSQTELIKDRLDIVEVIQKYVPSLKPSGRNYFGLCPFHNEKSPSFSVNPELKIFKCFGCSEGGDVITFLEKVEGIDFREALEMAAKMAGVELEAFDNPQLKAREELKKKALAAHKLAAEYYHFVLMKHPSGKIGLEYAINKRQLTEEIVIKYKLGFSPTGYHNLENYLIKKGFQRKELVEMGLLVEKDGRIFDKFRGRLLHPIYNLKGEVIAFSGRIIDPNSKAPKYLNSPETVIYKKKESLYGIYQAKEAMRLEKKVILVEGNIDVVSSAKIGVMNIVCPLGTALTHEQLKLMKRYVEEVIFCFDTDSAGKKALLRGLELAEQAGITAKAINIGKYKDVDELVVKEPENWKGVVERAIEIPEYVMEIFKNDYDLADASAKVKYLNMILPFIAKLRNPIKQDHYLQRLELISGTKYQVLIENVQKIQKSLSETAELEFDTSTTKKAQNGVTEKELEEIIDTPTQHSQQFINLIQYCYAWKDLLTEPVFLQRIYQHRLPLKEEKMLDWALGFECPDLEPDLLIELSGLIQAQTSNLEMDITDAQEELHTQIVGYTRKRVKQSIKALQRLQQLKNQGVNGAPGLDQDLSQNIELLQRLSEATKVLKLLEKELKKSI